MSMFLVYDAENAEYLLQPAGYAVLALFLVLLFVSVYGRRKEKTTSGSGVEHLRQTKSLVFCAAAIALATVTSFLKLASLPFGGSITMFSMLFIVLIGNFYGLRIGLTVGIAHGILQLILDPYIYAPLQVLLDYPLAFGALGLSGIFHKQRHGLLIGYITGVAGRYLCHVISGYIFFAEYAPAEQNPMVYTLGYNLTYILPELIATIILLSIPAVTKAISQVKKQALG